MFQKLLYPVLLIIPAALVGWHVSRAIASRQKARANSQACAHSLPNATKQEVWKDHEDLYQDATYEELEAEIDALRAIIRETTTPYYDARYAEGAYDVVGHCEPNQPFKLPPTPDMLCSTRFSPSGEVARVVLPEDQFPETYELFYRVQLLIQLRELRAPLVQ